MPPSERRLVARQEPKHTLLHAPANTSPKELAVRQAGRPVEERRLAAAAQRLQSVREVAELGHGHSEARPDSAR